MKAEHCIIFLGLTLAVMIHPLAGQPFVLNGSATFLGGECYQLTPDNGGLTATIFSQNTIDLTQPFNLDATLFFGCKDGNGADGINFIFATSNTALGVGGGGIGYQGITPSIAVEMDDYFNSEFNDPSPDHMAIISMGNVNHSQPTNLAGPMNLPNVEDCMEHCFFVSWNPATMTLTATLDDDVISYTGDIITNIFSGVTQVYYGFSAGTGGLSNIHRVCFGPPLLEAMSDVTICEGESVELQADENGVAWDWAPDPTLSSLNISNPTATPDITTEYTTVIEYACGYYNNDTVVVTLIPMPTATASNDGPVCVGEALHLMSSGGTSYDWSGPMGYNSSQQNPVINNIDPDMAGTYYVTVTDAFGCTAETFTEVEIDLGPEIEFDPLPALICENSPPIQLAATPVGGTWSGDVSADGIFDPAYVGVGVHEITYTATNANNCTNSEIISIEVFSIPDVIINPPGILCEDGDPVQLTGNPPGGIWEGEITLNGLFDPGDAGEGIHLITYTANDANGCTNAEEILIEVVQEVTVEIIPQGPFCTTDSIITLTATPTGGVWGGVADPSGNINPGNLGAGFHEVTYESPNQSGCFSAQLLIEIISPPQVMIQAVGPLCLNAPLQTLSATPSGGVWSGAANSSGIVDPVALGPGFHNVFYTYTLSGGCSGVDTFIVQVLPDAPQIDNLNIACDSLATSYVVSFTISGGDPLSYSVTGTTTGTLIPGNPYIFTSQSIPVGSAYNFMVTDAFRCDTAAISGSFVCNCATNAGMMDLNSIIACEGDTISVLPPVGVVLDPNDTLLYVLHLGFPDSIILISASSQFAFAPPLQTGITYFISTVAGNASPGGIDLTDPCLSVSFGTPVSWVSNPYGYLTGPSQICKGEDAVVSFILSPVGIYDVTLTDGQNIYSLDNIPSGFTFVLTPIDTTVLTLLDITDTSAPGCHTIADTSLTIGVADQILVLLSASICEGDSIFLGNSFQTTAGIYTDTLMTSIGCDSVVVTALGIYAQDTTYINSTSCDSSSTGVTITTEQNINGCDSTIITTVTYSKVDTTLIQSATCDMQAAGVFTNWFLTPGGCDSLVIETVEFIPADTTSISSETCNEAEAGIFTTTMNNAEGCDSLIIETINFLPPDTTVLQNETCDPASAGTFTYALTNLDGCDSLVIETINLLPSDTVISNLLTCSQQDTGIQVLTFTNMHGCDSLAVVITSLAPDDTCHVIIVSKNIFVPNIFSPNGDGMNDHFLIFTHSDAMSKINYLRIFDRWGGLVLEHFDILPNDPQHGWDGTEKGQPVSPGVYVWTINVSFADGTNETITGNVTVSR